MAKSMDISKPIVLIIDDEYRSFRSLLRLIAISIASTMFSPFQKFIG